MKDYKIKKSTDRQGIEKVEIVYEEENENRTEMVEKPKKTIKIKKIREKKSNN